MALDPEAPGALLVVVVAVVVGLLVVVEVGVVDDVSVFAVAVFASG